MLRSVDLVQLTAWLRAKGALQNLFSAQVKTVQGQLIIALIPQQREKASRHSLNMTLTVPCVRRAAWRKGSGERETWDYLLE